jgi:hypothetical protein
MQRGPLDQDRATRDLAAQLRSLTFLAGVPGLTVKVNTVVGRQGWRPAASVLARIQDLISRGLVQWRVMDDLACPTALRDIARMVRHVEGRVAAVRGVGAWTLGQLVDAGGPVCRLDMPLLDDEELSQGLDEVRQGQPKVQSTREVPRPKLAVLRSRPQKSRRCHHLAERGNNRGLDTPGQRSSWRPTPVLRPYDRRRQRSPSEWSSTSHSVRPRASSLLCFA